LFIYTTITSKLPCSNLAESRIIDVSCYSQSHIVSNIPKLVTLDDFETRS